MPATVRDQARSSGARFLVDAYCGSGLFALACARAFDRVGGVEVSESSVACARENSAANGIANASFIAGDASSIFSGLGFAGGDSVVVIDPPRKGCDEAFLGQLFEFRPRAVVYVSCDPATQMRDLKGFLAAGYGVTAVQPFDLFPQTRHLECVVTLSRDCQGGGRFPIVAAMSDIAPPSHRWNFTRSGGLDQVSLKSGADLTSLGELDQKLWVALSCPVKGLQIDERTLTLIDADGDGHVRPPEVIAAVSWACARLKDPGLILKGVEPLPLDAIGTTPEGAAVAEAARWILSRLAADGTTVLAAQAAEVSKAISMGPLKGDGILRPEAAPDDATRKLIKDINACCGETTEKTVAAFYSDLAAFKAWSEAEGTTAASGMGPAAAEAFAAVAAVRSKVADYFARTQLAAYDPTAVQGMNLREEDFRAIAAGELAADSPPCWRHCPSPASSPAGLFHSWRE